MYMHVYWIFVFIKYLLVDVRSEMLAKSHLALIGNLFEEKRDKWRESSRNVMHRKNIYRDPRVSNQFSCTALNAKEAPSCCVQTRKYVRKSFLIQRVRPDQTFLYTGSSLSLSLSLSLFDLSSLSVIY